MIFGVQRSLEDYIAQRGLNDPDQYSVMLAKLYSRERAAKSEESFLSAMRKMRTAFFRANPKIQRSPFERTVLARLDAKFKKKDSSSPLQASQQRLKHPVAV